MGDQRAFDRLVVQDGVLQDFKVSTSYAARDGGRQEWEWQLNVLATILREHGYQVSSIEVIVIVRDWNRNVAERDRNYPQSQAVRIPMSLWSEERREEFIDERIRLHQAAWKELPDCTPGERWSRPAEWALMKEGRKSAVRLYDSEQEATAALEKAGPKHSVDCRPGRDLRCESFCPVVRFCDQKGRQLAIEPTTPANVEACSKPA